MFFFIGPWFLPLRVWQCPQSQLFNLHVVEFFVRKSFLEECEGFELGLKDYVE